MRLSIDFDGVIADTANVKRIWLKKEIGLNFDGLALDRSSLEAIIGADVYSKMQSCVGYEDTLDAEPLPEAIETIAQLANAWSIHIVTARPPEKLFWVNRWLVGRGLDGIITSVVSTHGDSKMRIASQLGSKWLVDNDLRHYELGYGLKFLLFGQANALVHSCAVDCAPNWPLVWTRLSERDGADKDQGRTGV